ncbi:MAG TPA: potassium transporter KefB [Bacteroidia bacterium]|jgi:hypothetical protein
MTHQPDPTIQPVNQSVLTKRILLGAGIALTLIIAFLLAAGEPDPAWGKSWMLKPLLIVPFAGACGGIFFHITDTIRQRGGWRKIAVNILSAIVYIVGLWMGFVLGLNGTMWN